MTISGTLKGWAKQIKRDGVTLWFAGKHAGTPWYAEALGVFVVAYALSPIDLIPDFIPVLGYFDDVILLPGLICLAIRLLAADVLADCRSEADEWMQTNGLKPSSRAGAIVILLLWLAVGTALWVWLVQPRMESVQRWRNSQGGSSSNEHFPDWHQRHFNGCSPA